LHLKNAELNKHEWKGHVSYTYMCTEQPQVSKELETLISWVRCPIRYHHYINFVCMKQF